VAALVLSMLAMPAVFSNSPNAAWLRRRSVTLPPYRLTTTVREGLLHSV
jgi:hypothetical protein